MLMRLKSALAQVVQIVRGLKFTKTPAPEPAKEVIVSELLDIKLYSDDSPQAPIDVFRSASTGPVEGATASLENLCFDRDGGSSANGANTIKLVTRIHKDVTGYYEVAYTNLASSVSESPGALWNRWTCVAGPYTDTPHSILCEEMNPQERARDYGIQRNWGSEGQSTGLLIAPENSTTFSDGAPRPRGYNITFGLAFSRTGIPNPTEDDKPAIHVPIFMRTDCTAPGGVQYLNRGGATPEKAPLAMVEAHDYFQRGIDLTQAKLTDEGMPAIKLAPGQCIDFGNARIQCLEGRFQIVGKVNGVWQELIAINVG